MNTTVTLRGMTWSDPRGYDPMIAASEAFARANPGVSIQWDKRSLQGFESTPVHELAAAYDLMIIDHPHVGAVVAEGCLLALDEVIDPAALTALMNETVGKSFVSYNYAGHQWALPVDAATQVQAHRPDLGDRVTTWAQVVRAAQEGTVILPLRPPHALMCVYTLAANLGCPCGSGQEELMPAPVAEEVFAALAPVVDLVDPACFEMDPIAVLDALAESDTLRLAPLTYLYKGYADQAFRTHRIAFSDMPVLGKNGPIGSALGGTGLAISATSAHREVCAAFAAWVAGAECQRTLYTRSNGQPGNAVAWADAEVNKTVMDAYRNTRLTHEAAWLRPRHNGYMGFQEDGSHIVNDILRGKTSVSAGVTALNAHFAASFRGKP
ncbi:type 2 periplasmic-binding domain-containing protein [Oceanomicrobium pacificus]|uniref:Extracellular solute-binding protein n=1 Tax=Oceanomicrobium pacificus TaxID=2692916 RepID=A0A6B0TSB9_9RHOB|nr:extracellular solute-binding protein [Oceanomicrobium pacificus]MXU66886.1 extracellular solute-binding protein [Oceanomicrobium pacificus]